MVIVVFGVEKQLLRESKEDVRVSQLRGEVGVWPHRYKCSNWCR